MKKLVLIITTSCFILASYIITAQPDIPYTAEEILEKCIQFHDPEGKWENYAGKINLNYVNEKGINNGVESIEIDVKNDFYKCTRINNKGIEIIKGKKNGKLFRTVNGSIPSEDQINKFGLNDEQIEMMKNWHYFHFGKMMHLKKSGLIIKSGVSEELVAGRPCYTITMLGEEDKVTHPAWKGDYHLKVDKNTFQLLGMDWALNNQEITAEFKGHFEIEAIKIPLVVLYHIGGKDNLSADQFSKVIE